MPKMKTKKALTKRVKVTKNGKVLLFKGGRRHLLSGKSQKRKRQLRRKIVMSHAGKNLIKTGLPYA